MRIAAWRSDGSLVRGWAPRRPALFRRPYRSRPRPCTGPLLGALSLARNTAGSRGNSAMARQSFWVALNHREASILVRLEGPASKERDADKTSVAQRAKAGRYPSCAAPTHVAAPPPYVAGADGPPKEKEPPFGPITAPGADPAWLPFVTLSTSATEQKNGVGRQKVSLSPCPRFAHPSDCSRDQYSIIEREVI